MGRLEGTGARVTGAGRGIGREIARCFAREGARVVVAERDAARGAEAADEVGGVFVATDVAEPASAAGAVEAALARFGRVDVLVNNAGINVFGDPLATSDEDWRRCMAVDLDGAWHMARAVLPGMLAQGAGAIVMIASSHSSRIIPGCFPYPVAKHGLLGLTRALAIEYAARGVRVNAIAPGYVETELARAHWAGFADPEAERQRVCALHPPGRIGRPEEVAMTAVFLASDEAPFINGASIPIDGGRSVLYHE
jgi:NAD(P)-dependent dehydrogenase (short-subunit alcohol dehydrogenase family)